MLKKSLLTAMLVAVVVLATGAAQADMIDGLTSSQTSTFAAQAASPTRLYVNPGGLGDALIYGYYNVRSGVNLIKVVNTAESTGVAVKIRFREGHFSAEVLDFFICLSAADQWTAALIPGASATAAGQVLSLDNDTPTFPALAFGGTFEFIYDDPYSAVTSDMTQEGYFEILGISAWSDTPGPNNKSVATSDECRWVATGGAGGVAPSGFTLTDINNDVPNSLMGNSSLWNLSSSSVIDIYEYNATPIAYCRTQALLSAGLGADDAPRFDDCQPLTAISGLREVNFALTKTNLYGIYELPTFLGGSTNYIVTFPTKRLSIDVLGDDDPFDGVILSDGSIDDGAEGNACEDVNVKIWSDDELTTTQQIGVSPPRQGRSIDLCDEVNVIVAGAGVSEFIPSDLVQFNINIEAAGFDLGWLRLGLNAEGQSTTVGAFTASGLPAIAYELQDYQIGSFEMNPSLVPMRYDVNISTAN